MDRNQERMNREQNRNTEDLKWKYKIDSLVIFRNLRSNLVFSAFASLIGPHDAEESVRLYGEFAARLFEEGTDDWSGYLLRCVLEDENGYITRVSAEGGVPQSLAACLEAELALLEELARITSAAVRAGMGYSGFLPDWKTAAIDFASAYRERIAGLAKHGWGIFAKHKVFVVEDGALVPVRHPDPQSLVALYGYEAEREKVLANTRALLEGRPANNVLLYGDAGTGKSSTVKAVANELADEGLRLIEVKKNQLYEIADIVERLSGNPLKFIIFIDDLSFSQNDNDFAALKAILEGSVSACGNNIAVYATSNRRHLIKETFSDREGDDVHLYDTMQELMSLSARFGLTITFSRPEKELYCDIVQKFADLYEIDLEPDKLRVRAEAFAIRNGGRSPRTAKQFIELMAGGVLPAG